MALSLRDMWPWRRKPPFRLGETEQATAAPGEKRGDPDFYRFTHDECGWQVEARTEREVCELGVQHVDACDVDD